MSSQKFESMETTSTSDRFDSLPQQLYHAKNDRKVQQNTPSGEAYSVDSGVTMEFKLMDGVDQ